MIEHLGRSGRITPSEICIIFQTILNVDNHWWLMIFSGKLRDQMKSEMGKMSEKLEAMKNSATEDGGQIP